MVPILPAVLVMIAAAVAETAAPSPAPVSAPTASVSPDRTCSDAAPELGAAPRSSPECSPALATAATPTAGKTEPLEPLFVRPLVGVKAGRNDSNPVWSPRGTFIAFERSIGDKKEIHINLPDGTPVQTIYHLLSGADDGAKFFLPGVSEEVSYNAGITWSPDELRLVYMSNGGEGNYDLYYQDLGGAAVTRLTDHKEKDGQAHWSPAAGKILFVSGRTGNGDGYLMDLPHCALDRLTGGKGAYLYPRWSPDGARIAFMRGSNENHDIVVVSDPYGPRRSERALTTWVHDDLRPMWSPDGTKIAFYSNYNDAGDARIWSLMVVAADGTDPVNGDGLAARMIAADIIPDVETGPAWLPDGNRIAFVRNDRQEYNPVYVADLRRRTTTPVRTDTRMNHDIACSPDGTIAFRAQVDQWDQIFIMKLRD